MKEIFRNATRKAKRIYRKIDTATGGLAIIKRPMVFVPLLCGIIAIGVLAIVEVTQYETAGYLTESGFAVSENIFSGDAQKDTKQENIQLVSLERGDQLFSWDVENRSLFVGEEKIKINSQYPIFVNQGQVLYFFNTEFELVTSEWETLGSYNGLYLSDGTTYNENGSQADTEEILLVQVEDGYQLAQSASVQGAMTTTEISLNSICMFLADSIVYYQYEKGNLVGNKLPVDSKNVIKIGSVSCDYGTFLKNLGLWEESKKQNLKEDTTTATPVKVQTPIKATDTLGAEQTTTALTSKPEKKEKKQKDAENKDSQWEGDETQAPQDDSTESSVSGEGEPAPPVYHYKKKSKKEPKPASTALEIAAPAVPVVKEEEPVVEETDTGIVVPTYAEPKVTFGEEIQAWIYNLTIDVTVEDPFHAMQSLRVIAYEINGDEKIVAHRLSISRTDTYILDPLRPGKKFEIVAEMTYTDRLGYDQKKSYNLGTVKTLGYDKLKEQLPNFTFADVASPNLREPIVYFGDRIQLRDLTFHIFEPGDEAYVETEVGGIINHPSKNKNRVETYINYIEFNFEDQFKKKARFRMDSSALQLLQEGYLLTHWETPKGKLESGRDYQFEAKIYDKFGVQIYPWIEENDEGETVVNGSLNGSGHTCSKEPEVALYVDSSGESFNEVEIDVMWMNPDNAIVEENPDSLFLKNAGSQGETLKAALFIVRSGDSIAPENAIPISAQRQDGNDTTVYDAKFLPIDIEYDETITEWVVTKGLASGTDYTVAVLVGSLDVKDGQKYSDKVLEGSRNFTTATLANLGTVGYTLSTQNLVSETAEMVDGELVVTMNSVNRQLLKYLSKLEFVLRESGSVQTQKLTIHKEEWQQISMELKKDKSTGRYKGSAVVPFYKDKETSPVMATVQFSTLVIPNMETNNPWDYLVYGSQLSSSAKCQLIISLGQSVSIEEGEELRKLFQLESVTLYELQINTYANSGGDQEDTDVSNQSTSRVQFITKAQDAAVYFPNVYIGKKEIQIFDLSFYDKDNVIMKDTENRGGDNVYLRITDNDNQVIATQYFNAKKTYEGATKITGLEENTTYHMTFYIVKHKDQQLITKNYAMMYQLPQDKKNPKVFTFTTGSGLNGDISLENVSQLYLDDNNAYTDAIGLVDANDYYTNVFQQGRTIYYYLLKSGTKIVEENSAAYWDAIESVEDGKKEITLRDSVVNFSLSGAPSSTLSSYKGDQRYASKLIPVSSGDKVAIYNNRADTGYYVSFFYEYQDNAGNPRLGFVSSVYSIGDGFLGYGSIIQAPEHENLRYMVVSGCSYTNRGSQIIEIYDEDKVKNAENLVQTYHVKYENGMYLDSSNGLVSNASYAYTRTYIPVNAGSVYQISNRDPYIDYQSYITRVKASSGAVLFYDENYNFISSYQVNNQKGLVKAPSSAAFCRFNVKTDRADDGTYFVHENEISFQEYHHAEKDRYVVKLGIDLLDNSEPEKQLMTKGAYRLTLYNAPGTVRGDEDLESLRYDQYGYPLTVQVGEEDFLYDQLNVERILEYYDLPANTAFKAKLELLPENWNGTVIEIDTVFFTTCRSTYVINNAADFRAIINDPSGSYLVNTDLKYSSGQLLSSARPFTGMLDFQGHSLTQTDVNQDGNYIFDKVSRGGTIKNLVYKNNVQHTGTGNYATNGFASGLVRSNYGQLQNIVVELNVACSNRYFDMRGGAIVGANYGTIDGFIVRLMKDIRITGELGGVAASNYGTIENGYICGGQVYDERTKTTRTARFISPYVKYLDDKGNTVIAGADGATGGIVAYNRSTGVIRHVFNLCDLEIQSESATGPYNNADYTKAAGNNDYDSYDAKINPTQDGLITGLCTGKIDGAFTVGDRIDYAPSSRLFQYMLSRGPAVPSASTVASVENVTYFSATSSPYNDASFCSKRLKEINQKGNKNSLHDYKWYLSVLGADGDAFEIRSNVEEGSGYYPTLILPDCFDADVQPLIELPQQEQDSNKTIKIMSKEIREEGKDSILVTLSLDFALAESSKITQIDIKDKSGNYLQTEILAQNQVGKSYQVDILCTKDSMMTADLEYYISEIKYNGGAVQFNDIASLAVRTLQVDFYTEIDSIEQWKNYAKAWNNTITGTEASSKKYLLTADLDFSNSTTYTDWYVNTFYGTLDGGIYEEKQLELTDCLGNVILDKAGNPRTITIRGEVIGMHSISGIGTVDKDGNYLSGRDYKVDSKTYYSGRLFTTVSGATIKNLIFSNFHTILNQRVADAGVIAIASNGSYFENCHVRDSNFYATTYLGALVAQASASSFYACSAGNVQLESQRIGNDTGSITMGGLFGYAYALSSFYSCFTTDVTITARSLYSSEGIGGLGGKGNFVTIEDCYANTSIDAYTTKVGGLIGSLLESDNNYSSNRSKVSGCWTAGTVQTSSDYAGGIIGYHAGGEVCNNYTMATIVTRTAGAINVHRICNNATYSETSRHDNYAYEGQYLTYQDEDGIKFGIWSETDGATNLLSQKQLSAAGAWENVVGLGERYDLTGSGFTFAYSGKQGGMSRSGGTQQTRPADGIMPKLKDLETGCLIYDQPDIYIHGDRDYQMEILRISEVTGSSETFVVEMLIGTDNADYQEKLLNGNLENIAEWEELFIFGGVVDQTYQRTGKQSYGGINDLGIIRHQGKDYRYVAFRVIYGDKVSNAVLGKTGNYFDSYMISLNIYKGSQKNNIFEAGVTMAIPTQPIYKEIRSASQWDTFFSNERHREGYDNVKLCFGDTKKDGIIDFADLADAQGKTVTTAYNVKVNRLIGEVRPDGSQVSIQNANFNFSSVDCALISNISCEIANIDFINCAFTNSGRTCGIVNSLAGKASNLKFQDITITGSGIITVADREVCHIEMENIKITCKFTRPTGGLVGQVNAQGSVHDVQAKGVTVSSNSQSVGGFIGRTAGQCYNLEGEQFRINGTQHIGGAIGDLASSAIWNEPIAYNITLGDASQISDTPGVLLDEDGTPMPSIYVYGSSVNVGGVVGYMSGSSLKVQDLEVYNGVVYSTYTGTWTRVGGIIGCKNPGSLSYCYAKNMTVFGSERVGGILGYGSVSLCEAQDCVVIGYYYVGGITGNDGGGNSIADHCIVIGGQYVAGINPGNQSVSQSGIIDCTVVGLQNVGGFTATTSCSQSYALASLDADGEPCVSTKLTEKMLKPYNWNMKDATKEAINMALSYDNGNSETGVYLGTTIYGKNHVGGAVSVSWSGVEIRDVSIGTGVTVQGTKNVGGLIGFAYGQGYSHNVFYMRTSICSAEVIGDERVGGFLGYYCRPTDNPATDTKTYAYADHPNADGCYGLLFTGNVTGNTSVGFVVGEYSKPEANKNPTDATDTNPDYYIRSPRIYEGSRLTTADGSTTAGERFKYWNSISCHNLSSTSTEYNNNLKEFRKAMAVTAEDFNNHLLYFGGVGYQYGGMGFSRLNWSDESLQRMFVNQSSISASFKAYEEGIAQDGLVLWLDARNNTGQGYTDTEATTWMDLAPLTSGKTEPNNAYMVWGNNSNVKISTYNQRNGYLDWREGSLRVLTETFGYYLQLEESISPYLQDNYTVELITTFYSRASRIDGDNRGVFFWQDNSGGSGGFKTTQSHIDKEKYLRMVPQKAIINSSSTNSVSDAYFDDQYPNAIFQRTATFRVGKSSNKQAAFDGYVNGHFLSSGTKSGLAFNNTESTVWRIGYNIKYYNGCGIMVCGIRVYDRALTASEIEQNAEYDQWYYFNGETPTATPKEVGATIKLTKDGTQATISGGSGPYKLIRCNDKNYNGSLVMTTEESSFDMGSRGYYYVQDSSGAYSNIVEVKGPSYGPILRKPSDGYYGTMVSRNVIGQEGKDASGNLYDQDDYLYQGGILLPTYEGYSNRDYSTTSKLKKMMKSMAKFVMMALPPSLPELTAYASSVGTVNLELDGASDSDLQYRIISNSGSSLAEGTLLAGHRTLTMSWDYQTPFTVELSNGTSTESFDFGPEDLCNTVMTYGDDYWYLYQDTCYGSDNEPAISTKPEIVHMMNGQLLDADGKIWELNGGSSSQNQYIATKQLTEAFVMTETLPLWSGTVSGKLTESYGTYAVAESTMLDNPMFGKKQEIYTLPSSDIVIGSFIVDTYLSDKITAYVTSGGTISASEKFVFPSDKEFSNSNVVQISSNLAYSGSMVLVRYESGNLVAFNYLTGEKKAVLSDSDVSFLDYFKDALSLGKDKSQWSTGAQDAQLAATYQNEVASSKSLQNALDTVTQNLQTQAPKESGAGINQVACDGVQTIVNEGGQLIEGEFVNGLGNVDGSGTGTDTGSVNKAENTKGLTGIDGNSESEQTSLQTPEMSSGQPSSMGKAEEKGMGEMQADEEAGEGTDMGEDTEDAEDAEDAEDVLSQAAAGGLTGQNNQTESKPQYLIYGMAQEINTEYIPIYDKKSGTMEVYNLEEYVNQDQVSPVSENEKAEELIKLGMKTSLLGQQSAMKMQASGLLLLVVTVFLTAGLLFAMSFLKKKKLDD